MSRRKPFLHKPHEARVASLVSIWQPRGTMREEAVVPRHALRADIVIDGHKGVSPVWGPLQPLMEGQHTVVEVVAGHLSQRELRRYIAKATLLSAPSGPVAACRLVIVCRRVPSARLAELGATTLEPGLWEAAGAERGRIFIMVPDALEALPGRSAPRLLFQCADREEVRRRRAHLLTDPSLPSDVQREIWRRIRMRRVQASLAELEHLSMTEFHDEVLRRGESRGVVRGLEQGVARGVELGREALLRVASVLLSEAEMAALRPLPLEGLEAAINERIAALKGG